MVIWALLVLTAAGTSTLHMRSEPVHAPAAAQAEPADQPTVGQPAAVPRPSAVADQPPVPGSAPRAVDPDDAFGRVDESADADPETLPAWRWSTHRLDSEDGGLMPTLAQAQGIIATALMSIANVLWTLLLWLLRIGMGADVMLVAASGALNRSFALIADQLVLLLPLFGAVLLWRVVRLWQKRDTTGVIRAVVIFGLCFAVLAGMAFNARNLVESGEADRSDVPGTPPWVANLVINAGVELAAPLAAPILPQGGESLTDEIVSDTEGFLDREGVDHESSGGSLAPTGPDCTDYMAVLHRQYSNADGANRILQVLSSLWESTFFDSWEQTLLGRSGTSDLPHRGSCHWAEDVNEISREDRVEAVQAMLGSDQVAAEAPIFGPHAGDAEQQRKAVIAWAACENEGGGWQVRHAYQPTSIEANDCADAFTGAGDELDSVFYLFGADAEDETTRRLSTEEREQASQARELGTAFAGRSGDPIVMGLMSVLVAGAFIGTLGIVGLGLFVSTLLAIAALVIALPMALVAGAFNSPRTKVLVALMLSSLLAKTVFTLLLAAMILLSGLFQVLIDALNLPGFINGLLYGSAPLIALYIVYKILNAVGLGDIIKPTGAATFATTAAMKAAGDATGNSTLQGMAARGDGGQNALERGISNTRGLSKLNDLNSFGIAPTNWTKQGRHRNRQQRRMDKARRIAHRHGRSAPTKEYDVDQLISREDDFQKAMKVAKRYGWDQPKDHEDAQELLERAQQRQNDGDFGAGAATRAQRRVTNFAAVLRRNREVEEGDDHTGASAATPATQASQGRMSQLLNFAGSQVPRTGRADPEELADGHRLDWVSGAMARESTLRNNDGIYDTSFDEHLADLKQQAREDGVEFDRDAAVRAAHLYAAEQLLDDGRYGTLELEDPLSPGQVEGARFYAAASYDCEPEDVLATATGITLPMPPQSDAGYANLSLDQLRHPVNFLPEHDRVRIEGETEQDYATRLYAQCVSRGLVSSDGQPVDVIANVGLDIDDVDDQQRVQQWLDGNADQLLDQLRFDAAADEPRRIQAMVEVNRQAAVSHESRVNDWHELVVEAGTSVEALPRDTEAVAATTEQVSAAITSLSIANTKIAEAQQQGNTRAAERAADRSRRNRQQLENLEQQLADELGEVIQRQQEAAAATLVQSGVPAAEIDRVLAAQEAELSAELGQLRNALDGVVSGAVDTDAATGTLAQAVQQVTERSRQVATDFETTFQNSPTGSPIDSAARRYNPEGDPARSAADASEQMDAEPLP